MSKNWRLEVVGGEGIIEFYGVNIFDYEWKATGEKADVRDPHYDQKFSFPVYTVDIDGNEIRFAAGEFSPYVWAFYVERQS